MVGEIIPITLIDAQRLAATAAVYLQTRVADG
jgi:hypothetical protein